MNKALKDRFINHNKWMIILSISLLSLMTLQNVFINFLIVLAIAVIALRQVFYFIPLRFNDDKDDNFSYTIYKIIPIKNKALNLYNILNAILWSFIILLTIILYTPVFINISYDTIFYIKVIITSLIPVLLAIFDNYISKARNITYQTLSLFTAISMLIIPIKYDNSGIRIYIMLFVLALISFISLFANRNGSEYKSTCDDKDFPIINNRLAIINNTTRYYLSNNKRYIDYGSGAACLYWLMADKGIIMFISLFIINLGLINIMLRDYYLNNNLIRLLPISLKEKKLSCNIFTIIALIIINIFISILLSIRYSYDFDITIRNISVLTTMAILGYSLVITFFHRKDDLFIAIMAFVAFISLSYGLYHFYPKYQLLTLIPIILISIILMCIDYYQNKTS